MLNLNNMIHFKNLSGLTLLETMLALALAAIVMSPLFILEGTVLDRVATLSAHLQRLLFAKDFLYSSRRQQEQNVQEFSTEKKIDDPTVTLRYKLGPVSKKSSLNQFQGLLHEQVDYSWQWNGSSKSSCLVSFVYQPKEKEN